MKRWLVAIWLLIFFAIAALVFRSSRPSRPAGTPDNPAPLAPVPAATNAGGNPPIAPLPQAAVIENPTNVSVAQIDSASTNSTASAARAPETAAPGLASPGVPSLPASTLLENARTAIRDYGSMFGGNTVGNNAEITRALNGDNPKQVKFLSAESGLRVNAKGELIDPWGTPLFFHQLSGNETEIRSAGPDKVMWTADDLIIK